MVRKFFGLRAVQWVLDLPTGAMFAVMVAPFVITGAVAVSAVTHGEEPIAAAVVAGGTFGFILGSLVVIAGICHHLLVDDVRSARG